MKQKLKLTFKGWRKALIGVGALVSVLIIVGFVRGRQEAAAGFTTGRVERGNMRNTVSATGALQAVTTVQVGSQVSGTISALEADFNSRVRKGQIIAQLDPSIYQAQLAQAQANLAQARASLTDSRARAQAAAATVENQRAGVSGATANLAALGVARDDARSQLRRQESLAASGVIAQRELESARTNYEAAEARYQQAAAQLTQSQVAESSASGAGRAQAQAQIQQAQAALRLAEVNLSHTTIRSPIDGVVVSRDIDVGQTVAASLSAPTLFTIANDLTQMQVIANIDQADIGQIDPANRVVFTVDAFPGERFRGKIRQVRLNPQNTSNVITYHVVIDVENPELKLKPGMTADLTFTVAERNQVLKVPNAALRFSPTGSRAPMQGSARTVYVQGADGKPQERKIEIGITDGTTTEVTGGDLKEGETVITGRTQAASGQATRTQAAPGFGNAPGGMGGGGRRR